jgi:hypothetical protein
MIIVQIANNEEAIMTPQAIIDYNTGISSDYLSDRHTTYFRRSIKWCRWRQQASLKRQQTSTRLHGAKTKKKWYRKLAVQKVLGIAVINAYFLCRNIKQDDISITNFRDC